MKNDTPNPEPSRTSDSNQATIQQILDPACGTGAFLLNAPGIYVTPQHILDYIEGKPDAGAAAIIGNPPFAAATPPTADQSRSAALAWISTGQS